MEDRCVSCGAIIPEGRQVCESCERGDRKFTDDEVIKALMCCIGIKKLDACADCPMCLGCNDCVDLLREESLALINRQRATIESMAKLVEGFEENCNTAIKIIDHWEKAYASAKAKAIKEFAERLKEKAEYFEDEDYYFYYVTPEDIDNLVKEMTEGGGSDA